MKQNIIGFDCLKYRRDLNDWAYKAQHIPKQIQNNWNRSEGSVQYEEQN